MTAPLPPAVTISEGQSDRAPLLLLHGFLESPAIWQALPERLWPNTDAFAVPLPGHAPWHTTRADLDALLTGDKFLDSYATLIERLRPGRPWRLVGHSTGALVALALARRVPHLVQDVLAVAPLFSGAVCGRNLHGALVRLPVLGPMSFRWLLWRWLGDALAFDQGVRTVMANTKVPEGALEGMRQDLLASDFDQIYRFGCWIGSTDMGAEIPRIERPVHAMICDRDPVIDPHHQLALISAAPRASAVMLKSGHLPMLETPQAFARAFAAWRNQHTAFGDPRPMSAGLAADLAARVPQDMSPVMPV